MENRLLACGAILLLLFTMVFTSVPTAAKAEGVCFAGGDGSPENPYLVSTAVQLMAISANYNKHFKQINDIDLGAIANWTPLCQDLGFRGSYDGNNMTIRNLTIVEPTGENVGFFAASFDGDFLNIVLENANITGWYNVGSLVGFKSIAKVENCRVIGGSVSGNDCVGGLIGTDAGTVSKCYARVTVNGVSKVGGLLGSKTSGKMNLCYATSNVTGQTNVGGLIGNVERTSDYVFINKCFASGNVNGKENVGGLVGRLTYTIMEDTFALGRVTLPPSGINGGGLVGTTSTPIINSYSAGAVVGGEENIGGLIGRAVNNPDIESCYYDRETSGRTDTDRGTPKSTAEMMGEASQNIFVNWDTATWTIVPLAQYPLLQDLKGYIFIFIEPPGVIQDGPQWTANDGLSWAAPSIFYPVPFGNQSVRFNILPGWNSPADIQVNVAINKVYSFNARYLPKSYSITVNSNPLAAGFVAGGGTYTHGSLVTLTASPSPGYQFVNWTEAGTPLVGIGKTYSFRAEEDRNLVANFNIEPVQRIAGENRYATAVEISRIGWPHGTGTVVLARGDDYADALAGVPLAYQLDAPILLTNTSRLIASTKDEISRLRATEVIILGGPGAVSNTVAQELVSLGLTVERLAGSGRYHTAALIAERITAINHTTTVFVATGTNFADALSASAYGAVAGYPILLTQPNRLPAATETVLANLGINKTWVIGGTGVIGKVVFDHLPNPQRIAGNNRYGTGIALAELFLPSSSHHIYMATGLSFPDAIAGGVLAAKRNSGVLLIRGDRPAPNQEVQDFLIDRNFNYIGIFGGWGAVSSEIENWLRANMDR